MKKAKILLFGLVLSVFSICSFSSAQFVESTIINCSDTTPIYCSDFYSSTTHSLGMPYIRGYLLLDGGGKQSFGSPADSMKSSNYSSYGKVVGFQLRYCEGTDYGDDFIFHCNTDKMPVSELSPVITGLINSINEFIPYVVYIGLGVLGVIVGFFAIKRLLRFVKGSSLSVFSSRRKKK